MYIFYAVNKNLIGLNKLNINIKITYSKPLKV